MKIETQRAADGILAGMRLRLGRSYAKLFPTTHSLTPMRTGPVDGRKRTRVNVTKGFQKITDRYAQMLRPDERIIGLPVILQVVVRPLSKRKIDLSLTQGLYNFGPYS